MIRKCQHCCTSFPTNTPGRGGKQSNRKFCSIACKRKHRTIASRVDREIKCQSCGESRTIRSPHFGGGKTCRRCAALKGSQSAAAVKRDPLERLMSKVHKSDAGCWTWQGHRQPNGYGAIYHEGRTVRTHRLVYWLQMVGVAARTVATQVVALETCRDRTHDQLITPAENSRRKAA